ncbi:D-cysteine desulfhydrase [Brachybacterium endophyticum]|uniref:D-cysteine desulfhydrase n=1 Tax=Brachybacterium endophyticum TaxID=2182385 RepID=A0A2U2RK52_9MICO|nr:D-cysteine desulfhydrase [Brachybacterium endophyticum]PWH06185.1 D-cysteine desulfhydrase [Brachybacterium endophyticum]
MDLSTFPRRRYTDGPTRLQHLPRLSAELGGPDIWLKRDDELGLTLGGNKTRKLEFLVAEALDQGADTLITAGGVQSNHCRLTLAAARAEGLQCHLVLEEDLGPDGHPVPGGTGANPPQHTGNHLLFDLLGADSVEALPHGADLPARMQELSEELTAQGRTPVVIPIGGSNATGALGYVDAADELLDQFAEQSLDVTAIVVPSGSTGMQAGLITGLHAAGSSTRVLGINVSRSRAEQEPKIRGLVDALATRLDLPPVPAAATVGLGDYVGPGYALPTEGMVEALRLLGRTEGVVLDPVYTGKAAAGLIDLVRQGEFSADDTVVLMHSGGVPGLFARTDAFT